MKIYTKTGDRAETGLFGGTRVPKHHIRIEAYGTLDELNAHLGLLRDLDGDSTTQKVLTHIQGHLFSLGSILATESDKAERLKIVRPGPEATAFLETAIDDMDAELDPITTFVLPGGHPLVSQCHVARTVCRRAERRIAVLHDEVGLDPDILAYVNRLSDYLFTLSRFLARRTGASETPWVPEKEG